MPIYHIAVTLKKEGPIWIGKEKRYSHSEIFLILGEVYCTMEEHIPKVMIWTRISVVDAQLNISSC